MGLLAQEVGYLDLSPYPCDVEERQVDTDVHGGDQVVVLGVEGARIGDRQVGRLADALDVQPAEIDTAAPGELRQQCQGPVRGPQQRLHQVEAGPLLPQHAGEEDGLVDLPPFLVGLREPGLGGHLLAGGHQAVQQRGGVEEFVQPR
ncbi:hypothetical protein A4E84_32880 [Streptomyces qaidamensis]|uniref:Uncharacterized protein n=1 Tax=Streptomyces qaidamensis TaxID=1783515 RepID=A0A143C8X0_9ACTN|nr:hypothetical protein A4E84_32880 [Streptomyces qaidamensis]